MANDGRPAKVDARQPAAATEPTSEGALVRRVETLEQALRSRTTLAYAVGLLAGWLHLPTDEAWRLLVQISNDLNVRAHEVARVLVAGHDNRLEPGDRQMAKAVADQLPIAVTKLHG